MRTEQVDELIHAINQLTKEVRKLNTDRTNQINEDIRAEKLRDFIRDFR